MIYAWRLSIGHLPKECPLPSPFPAIWWQSTYRKSIGAAHIGEPYEAAYFSCICRDSS